MTWSTKDSFQRSGLIHALRGYYERSSAEQDSSAHTSDKHPNTETRLYAPAFRLFDSARLRSWNEGTQSSFSAIRLWRAPAPRSDSDWQKLPRLEVSTSSVPLRRTEIAGESRVSRVVEQQRLLIRSCRHHIARVRQKQVGRGVRPLPIYGCAAVLVHVILSAFGVFWSAKPWFRFAVAGACSRL
jgi:hypothetical protein